MDEQDEHKEKDMAEMSDAELSEFLGSVPSGNIESHPANASNQVEQETEPQQQDTIKEVQKKDAESLDFGKLIEGISPKDPTVQKDEPDSQDQVEMKETLSDEEPDAIPDQEIKLLIPTLLRLDSVEWFEVLISVMQVYFGVGRLKAIFLSVIVVLYTATREAISLLLAKSIS